MQLPIITSAQHSKKKYKGNKSYKFDLCTFRKNYLTCTVAKLEAEKAAKEAELAGIGGEFSKAR